MGPIPIDARHLFKSLDERLIALLQSLSEEDWNKRTVAVKWTVKDVASHLLDGNLRTLSMQRDGYFGEKPVGVHDYQELVNWLNRLNAEWLKATHRISPGVLIDLHRATGPVVSDYYASLDPWKEAVFSVDWAGESKSYNWMHVAREYTEKWHHQQQIREATNHEGIMTKEFFYPAISTFFFALPHTFSRIEAPIGTVVNVKVKGEGGGDWYITKEEDKWSLLEEVQEKAATMVEIPADISWKLFSKSLRPAEVSSVVKITGDQVLGHHVLEMVSVMA